MYGGCVLLDESLLSELKSRMAIWPVKNQLLGSECHEDTIFCFVTFFLA